MSSFTKIKRTIKTKEGVSTWKGKNYSYSFTTNDGSEGTDFESNIIGQANDTNDAKLMAVSKKLYVALDEVNSILSTLMENSNIRMLVLDDGLYEEAIEKANAALMLAKEGVL